MLACHTESLIQSTVVVRLKGTPDIESTLPNNWSSARNREDRVTFLTLIGDREIVSEKERKTQRDSREQTLRLREIIISYHISPFNHSSSIPSAHSYKATPHDSPKDRNSTLLLHSRNISEHSADVKLQVPNSTLPLYKVQPPTTAREVAELGLA